MNRLNGKVAIVTDGAETSTALATTISRQQRHEAGFRKWRQHRASRGPPLFAEGGQ
jgi:hypothetical protein